MEAERRIYPPLSEARSASRPGRTCLATQLVCGIEQGCDLPSCDERGHGGEDEVERTVGHHGRLRQPEPTQDPVTLRRTTV